MVQISPNHCLLDAEVLLRLFNGPDVSNSPTLQTQALVELITVGIPPENETIAVQLPHKVVELHLLLGMSWQVVRYSKEK